MNLPASIPTGAGPPPGNGLLPDHVAHHQEIAQEVHARPSPTIGTPTRLTHVAVQVPAEWREREWGHLEDLAALWGVAPPPSGASYFTASKHELLLRWERHGEFSSYTFVLPNLEGKSFEKAPIHQLPAGWMGKIPGYTAYAAHALLLSRDGLAPDEVSSFFGDHVLIGATIGGGAGAANNDFWIHDAGFGRFVVVDQSLTPRQAGRTVQRLFDIETYRMLALLAFPIAKALSGQIAGWERTLADLSTRISDQQGDDEPIMLSLTQLAAEVESTLTRVQSRFGASRAYYDLITRRIAELREERIDGLQTIEEFMSRRLSPAIATIASTERRLQDLSERVGQISTLLSTRVDIAHENQNQQLLVALNRRAEVQFHLQRAIEGLSIAAIVYYGAGLIGYLAKAAKSIGWNINIDLAIGISIPILTVLSFLSVHMAHRRIKKLESSPRARDIG